MHRKLIFILFIFVYFVSFGQIFADEGWRINSFFSDITIKPDGMVQIAETIDVDFNSMEKHGIYRDIPFEYQAKGGSIQYTKVEILSVVQDGHPAQYKTTKENGYIRIRIGDPNNTIDGKHSYKIYYLAGGVLHPYDSYDELYWNVTGNGWGVPIEKVTSNVSLPTSGIVQIACYYGPYGSTTICDAAESGNKATFTASNLSLYEGMTLAVGYTKGMVPLLSFDRPKTFIEQITQLTPLIVFGISLVGGIAFFLMLWMLKGRDYWSVVPMQLANVAMHVIKPIGAQESIVVEFEPPQNLRPAEMGTLIDERADTKDVAATLIDLATRGYIKINEIPKKWMFGDVNYEFEKTTKVHDDLLSYEKELIDRLFATGDKVKMSSLKKKFYDDLAVVKKKLYEEVMNKKLFTDNPESVRGKYIILSIVVLVVSGFLLFQGVSNEIVYVAVVSAGVVLSGIVGLVMSGFMPRRSALGRELLRRSRGYHLFISGAEKYKQQFFEKKNMFNEVLPYAVMFGLTEKYARAMEEMGVKPNTSSWYHGTSNFNTIAFASSMDNFSESVTSAMVSAPSSSGSGGGGSSGGGGGGGGGGSW